MEAPHLCVLASRGRRVADVLRAVLFGGFQDTGIRTSYLCDLWVWDTLEYKWHQIEISDVDRKPGCALALPRSSQPAADLARPYRARSGFSFLSCPEGLILHGQSIQPTR